MRVAFGTELPGYQPQRNAMKGSLILDLRSFAFLCG